MGFIMKYANQIAQLKDDGEIAGSLFKQMVFVFSVSYLCVSCGNFLGYTSSAIPSMREDVEMLSEISHHDISWIGGLGPLGALFGSLFTLIPLPYFGSRRTIAFFGSPILLLSWTLVGFSASVMQIFIGRFLGGVGTGIVIACVPLYVLDVSSIKIRGRLGIMPQFLMIFGILISYILGSFLHWRNMALSCALIAVPSMILLAHAPDSPSWLISKNRFEDAYRTLEMLHGEKQANITLRKIQSKDLLQDVRQKKRGGTMKRKVDMGMIKASIVSLGILSFQQLTGINGVTFYAVSIFREAAGICEIDAHIPSIILASTQLIASFMSTLFVEKFGRKILLIMSSTLMSVAGTVLGTYFYCGTMISYLFWVPLVALILFAFGFAIGFGPVAWILIAEILPQETRHIMNPLAIAYNWFCVFIVTKSFPLLKLEINIYGIFWLYAGFAMVGLIFVIFFIPETKGKTEEEIRLFFGNTDNIIDVASLSELSNMSTDDTEIDPNDPISVTV